VRPVSIRVRRSLGSLAAAALATGALVAPAAPAWADDVGPVSVETYECNPMRPPKPGQPCEPMRCEDDLGGQPCRKVCVDARPLDDALRPCVYTAPGDFVVGVAGACLGYFGDPAQGCVNGYDGCAAHLWGTRLDPRDGTCA